MGRPGYGKIESSFTSVGSWSVNGGSHRHYVIANCTSNRKNFFSLVIQTAKRHFYTDTFLTSNPKSLYGTLNSLLGTGSQQSPRQADDNLKLSNDFADYFKLMTRSPKSNYHLKNPLPQQMSRQWLFLSGQPHLIVRRIKHHWQSLTMLAIARSGGLLNALLQNRVILIRCLHGSLRNVLMFFYQPLARLLTHPSVLVCFQISWRRQSSSLRWKKQTLDHEVMKNYRPVSNIAFMSKVIELAVSTRLSSYLRDFDLQEDFQSAYKKFHSTETALLHVKQDIIQEIDQKKAVLFVLLDLSSAFDTRDHSILLARLQTDYGIQDTALQWLKSYLTGRTSRVSVKAKYSKPHTLKNGVPQGSVLGPLLFTMYIRPVGDILKRHGLRYHLYADDIFFFFFILCKSKQ